MKLTSTDSLTTEIIESGVVSWDDLTRVVANFKYGRNSQRDDFTLVWKERMGSCSSKHAFLKMVAELNGFDGVKLMLAIYKMNGSNTPGIKHVLADTILEYVPEAHCYLSVDNQKLDLTTPLSAYQKIENDILLEIEIAPEFVIEEKINFHKNFIREWIEAQELTISDNEIWKIRERCIKALS